jgi:hypothetical protein
MRKKPIEVNDFIISKMVEILDQALPTKAKISMPSLYRNWDEYLKYFCAHGGVVEASPTCLPS